MLHRSAIVIRRLGVVAFAASAMMQAGCTKSPAANAAIVAAANVAAAVALHEATGSCYATCAYGTQCDHKSGTCIPIRPEAQVEVDPCAEECAQFEIDRAAGMPPRPESATQCRCTAPPREPESASDPCGGMCMKGEKCVMRNGDLGCE